MSAIVSTRTRLISHSSRRSSVNVSSTNQRGASTVTVFSPKRRDNRRRALARTSGAEMPQGSCRASGRLQRGRARAGAECHLRNGHPGRPRCFNGAAPARARNAAGTLSDPFGQACFNGAAPARARNGFRCGENRSRPGRFNGAAPARARNVFAPVARLRPTRSFNGAAPARARNGWRSIATARSCQASTGPRPRGRGMH